MAAAKIKKSSLGRSRPSEHSRLLPSRIVTIQTPKRYLLNGFCLGPKRPQTVFVFLHGLGGNLFSRVELTSALVGRDTGVLIFNNRGSGLVSGIRRLPSGSGRSAKYYASGMAHEVFTECADDIDGAVAYARQLGARRIFLLGHSTGCQKSIYYLAKRPRSQVTGAILLAPMSDYADAELEAGPALYRRALAAARRLVKAGKKHELLPRALWPKPIDAQRFLSLYTPDSQEEIFGYASGRPPRLLQQVKKPLLVMLAEEDEFRDRPIKEIAAWFKAALARQKADTLVVKGVSHSFAPRQMAVKKAIEGWVSKI
ncbi:MAG: alpha/beta fold hydrolase [Patescibacteria group bacterium]